MQLHTDHYPWSEVTADLAARQTQGLSGVLEAWQGPHWARFVWVGGAPRGGFTAAADVSWPAALAALPRAQVTLTALDPAVAELIWTSRTLAPQPLSGLWPAPQDTLERQRFTGVLLGDPACSFWEGGRLLGGTLPAPGAACAVLTSVVPEPETGETGLDLWRDLVAAANRLQPLDDAWRQASLGLARQHPCLDPFAREVTVQGGRLEVDADLPAAEWRPALLSVFRATLARAGVRLDELPLAELRARSGWHAAGLEAL